MILSGFACRSCNFRLLLSNSQVGEKIVKSFTQGACSVSILCPQCGQEHQYTYFDLNVFPHVIDQPRADNGTLSWGGGRHV